MYDINRNYNATKILPTSVISLNFDLSNIRQINWSFYLNQTSKLSCFTRIRFKFIHDHIIDFNIYFFHIFFHIKHIGKPSICFNDGEFEMQYSENVNGC